MKFWYRLENAKHLARLLRQKVWEDHVGRDEMRISRAIRIGRNRGRIER